MSKTPIYGTADLWAEGQHNLAGVFSPHGATGFILGISPKNDQLGLTWNPQSMQGHALTFGATRSGKGVCSIIPALLTYSGSMVVIDPKGENAFVTAPRRRQLGQRVVILDPWGEVNRRYGGKKNIEQTTRFNPLSALNPADPDFADDCMAIADALIVDQSSDPHWSNSAREMLAGLVAAAAQVNPGTASLGQVRGMIGSPPDQFQEFIKSICEHFPGTVAARKLAGFVGEGREVGSIRSVARTQTAILDTDTLLNAMETDDSAFNLADLATRGTTLYLVLPLDRLQTHGRWLRLILTLAIRAISRQAEPPAMPVMFMLDEFGTIGRLAMIEQAFGLMAGIGIRVWAFLQDLNQLKRDYPQSWETFVANCSVIQVLNARDSTTSEYFANYLGARTVEIPIESASGGHTGGLFGSSKTLKGWSHNISLHSRPIYFPEELRRIPGDQVLIFFPGYSVHQQSRVVYHSEPRFAGMFRPLPAFPLKPIPIPPPPPRVSWFTRTFR